MDSSTAVLNYAAMKKADEDQKLLDTLVSQYKGRRRGLFKPFRILPVFGIKNFLKKPVIRFPASLRS